MDCFGDITGDHGVDVSDLIAVILQWGGCPQPTVPTALGCSTNQLYPPCPADIAPFVLGNDAVDVGDLISVILNWSACPEYEGGGIAGIPQSLQDCMNMCNSCCPEDYGSCLQRCLSSLCAQGMTQYCDD